jgi:hypothetical protein
LPNRAFKSAYSLYFYIHKLSTILLTNQTRSSIQTKTKRPSIWKTNQDPLFLIKNPNPVKSQGVRLWNDVIETIKRLIQQIPSTWGDLYFTMVMLIKCYRFIDEIRLYWHGICITYFIHLKPTYPYRALSYV